MLLFNKLRSALKPIFSIYPLVIIISIPLLLIANTLWNLKSFNRDANFIVRHQAVSIADLLKPQILENIEDPEKIIKILDDVTISNKDIISLAVFKKSGEKFEKYATSKNFQGLDSALESGLNQLAVGFKEPMAGLTYDPFFQKDVWNVTLPIDPENSQNLLFVKVDTSTVSEILNRTTKDSLIVLSILIIITVFLIANHFIFYIRSLKSKQLEELDKLKDEFISIAAHELRTPMTALIGYLEMLQSKLAPHELEKIKSDITTLNSIIADLNSLIGDILDVSRIEQGRLKITPAQADVKEILNHVITTLTPIALQKGLKLNQSLIDLPKIKSDPDRIRQVLTNLIGNSIKYTLKGEVSISSEIKDNFIKITVKDTGVGIPPEEIKNLFSKFHRVQDKQTQDVRGTGLGLWITKQIVELLGGKIFVESIYNTGSSFSFTLPIRA